MYKISVIIPCYNAEDTIERCIKSVINQSFGFENIELILYDDASTDNTPVIITDYSDRYENIVSIISKTNSGHPGKGRNTGIQVSNSDYIMFMDNDDEFHEEMCEKFYKEITLEDADLVSCSYINMDELNSYEVKISYLKEKADFESNDKVIFSSSKTVYFQNSLVWNSIFKKDLILSNNLSFLEDDFFEDIDFSLRYLLIANKVSYLKNFYGIYRHVQTDSPSSRYNLDDLNKLLDVTINLFHSVKHYDLDNSFIFRGQVYYFLANCYLQDLNGSSKKELILFLSKLRDFEIEIEFNSSIGIIFDFINYFVLRQHYEISILCFRLLKFIHNFDFLRKIYRKFFIN